jgi:hypothetical protein
MTNEELKLQKRTRRVRFINLLLETLDELQLDPGKLKEQDITADDIATLINKSVRALIYNRDVYLAGYTRVIRERDKLSQADLFRRAIER